MPDKNDFSRKTRETLAKRANQICSNPYCRKPTAGPHLDDDKNVDVGEAAHIRGARAGSKRYDPSMLPEERGSIVNGIWLCRKCAKLIDSDEKKYTVELLYEWKRTHEARITQEIEGNGWQEIISIRQLRPFEDESPIAYQIAIDKPQYWEYFLTVELLRSKLRVIERSYHDLERGILFRPSHTLLDKEQFRVWLGNKISDITSLYKLLEIIINEEITSAWGVPGQPGDAIEILRAVEKVRYGCEYLLEWEIDVHFTKFPRNFEPVREIMRGWTARLFSEVNKLSDRIAGVFDPEGNPVGKRHVITVSIDEPDFGQLALVMSELWDKN